LGRRLGRRLTAGQGVALDGELGAGKTVFTRGIAAGLCVEEPDEVRSPTYVLMVEHPGPIPLLHLDAYFAERSRDFLVDGGEAYLQEGGVLVVEWAGRLDVALPEEFLTVRLRHAGEEAREIEFYGLRNSWETVLDGLLDGF
jgi:tRNA threonylcarbamoyladenosine biosynthesis protein TsaE